MLEYLRSLTPAELEKELSSGKITVDQIELLLTEEALNQKFVVPATEIAY